MKEDKELLITQEEYEEFSKETDYEKKLQILLLHSKKNNLRIERKKIMERENKTEEEIKNEMEELNDEFSKFLHTKGIVAKFKLAFSSMAESAKKQHEKDVNEFNEVKAKSAEENKEFVELLHTKGFKAKCKLVVDNMKKSAKESKTKTAEQIAAQKAETKRQINANKMGVTNISKEITAEELSRQFNEFLKSKGLDKEYVVSVSEEKK